jgi:flagellar hook protein FlgE
VVGNNLANMNSTGFKTSDVSFQRPGDAVPGSGAGQHPGGIRHGHAADHRDFSQGAIQTSGGLLNGAISGEGFFVVQDPNGNTEYTRAGDFQTDKNGNLLTATGDVRAGLDHQSMPLPAQVDTNGPVGNIVVPVGTLNRRLPPPTFTADLNLNSAASADGTSTFSDADHNL